MKSTQTVSKRIVKNDGNKLKAFLKCGITSGYFPSVYPGVAHDYWMIVSNESVTPVVQQIASEKCCITTRELIPWAISPVPYSLLKFVLNAFFFLAIFYYLFLYINLDFISIWGSRSQYGIFMYTSFQLVPSPSLFALLTVSFLPTLYLTLLISCHMDFIFFVVLCQFILKLSFSHLMAPSLFYDLYP